MAAEAARGQGDVAGVEGHLSSKGFDDVRLELAKADDHHRVRGTRMDEEIASRPAWHPVDVERCPSESKWSP